MTMFFRLLDTAAKESALGGAVRDSQSPLVHFAKVETFRNVPGAPLSYWVSPEVLRLFRRHPKFESGGRTAAIGASTKNDFRYLRLAWETSAAGSDRPASHDSVSATWLPFAKGGSYSPFYASLHLAIDWKRDGYELKADISEYRGSRGWGYHWTAALNGHADYFRPGLTWPRRTQGGFGVRAMPAGCIFADKGPAAFTEGDSDTQLLALLSVMTSTLFCGLVELQMAFGSYEVGVVQRTPVPSLSDNEALVLARLARRAWSVSRAPDLSLETSHAFILPALLIHPHLTKSSASWSDLSDVQREIDNLVFRLYGTKEAAIVLGTESNVEGQDGGDGEDDSDENEEDSAPAKLLSPPSIASWTMGVTFGRFDYRLATGERPMPPEPEPFDPLPVCSPGMLTGDDGLPLASPPPGYAIDFPDDGILTDDPGAARDLLGRMRQVFDIVFKDYAEERWREAAELMGFADHDLRPWLRKDFFEYHIKRYSKSRRKAPIYWQLATPSASYSVWVYIHRFSKDTLFKVLNDHVVPKLQREERRLTELRQDGGPNPAKAQREAIALQESFVDELSALRDEVARVAPLWDPDLDDGVVINAAPLWRLFPQHKTWQKEVKGYWDELVGGKYDWAHLAMRLWPERVVPKCLDDRSLAIAHDLEAALWEENAQGKWVKRPVSPTRLAELIATRTHAAVKAALKDLLEAPTPTTARARAPRKAASPAAPRPARTPAPAPSPAPTTTPAPASTPTRTRRAAPSLDETTLTQVLTALTAHPGGLTKAELVSRTGLPDDTCKAALDALLTTHRAHKTGAARGTRYHSGPGSST